MSDKKHGMNSCILGSHSGDYEKHDALGSKDVQFGGSVPTFRGKYRLNFQGQ
jgi:hypothetical protein